VDQPTQPIPKPLQDLFSQLGLSSESVSKVKFGGIVGKVALIALFGFASTAACMTWAGSLLVKGACLLIIPGTTIWIIWKIFDYAERNPLPAVMDGAEMLIWQQQQTMLATKSSTPPKESPVIPNPEGAPPQLNPSQESDK
jgi:hypothetical protein